MARRAGEVEDRGFARKLKWDIDLTEGYQFELVRTWRAIPAPIISRIDQPSLVGRVVHGGPTSCTSRAGLASHLCALRAFRRRKIPILSGGDLASAGRCPKGPVGRSNDGFCRGLFLAHPPCLVVGKAIAPTTKLSVLRQIVSIRARIRSTSAGFRTAEPLDRDAARGRRHWTFPPIGAPSCSRKVQRKKRPWN